MKRLVLGMLILLCVGNIDYALGQSFVANDTVGCKPLVTLFQHGFTNVTSVLWDFGDGTTSTLQSPGKIYTASGDFTVSLSVTLNSGATINVVKANYISVKPDPVPAFTYTINNGLGLCNNTANVNFNSAGSSSDVNFWQWDFGNGTSSNDSNPVHTYGSSANYNVTLLVKNQFGCVATFNDNVNVVISTGVDADFDAADTIMCKNNRQIRFINNTTSNANLTLYQWNFGTGNGFVNGVRNAQFTYPSPGTYTVGLIAGNNLGCRDTLFKTFTFSTRNVAAAYTVSDTFMCRGNTLILTGTDTALTYTWFFFPGQQTSQVATRIMNRSGNNPIRLIVSDSTNCRDTSNFSIQVVNNVQASITYDSTLSCSYPAMYKFTGNVANSNTKKFSIFDPNGNLIGQSNNPIYNFGFPGPGIYKVLLEASAGSQCSKSDSISLFINQPLTQAIIRSNLDSGCAPLTVNFSNNSFIPVGATLNSIAWNFGDPGSGNNTSTAANVTHTFNVPGVYTVTLTITTSSGCTATITKIIKCGTPPKANFLPILASGCSPLGINFQNLSTDTIPTGGSTYTWILNNLMYFDKNPIVSLAIPGVYSVKLITSNNGCLDSMVVSNAVTVFPPRAQFTSPNRRGCNQVPHTVQFTDQSIGVDSWFWDFGDPTSGANNFSTAQNPTHTYAAFGTYTVKLVVRNLNGCIDSTVREDYVIITDPVANFNSNVNEGCKPLNIFFNNQSSQGDYLWNFGNGNVSNQTNPSNTYVRSGFYTVRLYVTDFNGCVDSMVRTRYIQVKGPDAKFSPDQQIYCLPAQVQFVDSSAFAYPVVNWRWDFGDPTRTNDTSSLRNPTYTYTTNGDFTVRLVAIDTSGCTDTLIKQALVQTRNPEISFIGDTLKCIDGLVNFSGTANNNPLSYQWTFGDGNVDTGATVTHRYSAIGHYNVKLKVSNGYGCVDSLTKPQFINITKMKVNFGASPLIRFCAPKSVNFQDSTANTIRWSWDFGDGTTSTVQNPSKIFTRNGYFTIKLVAEDIAGCIDSLTKDSLVRVVGPRPSYTFIQLDTCELSTVLFQNRSLDYKTLLWDFGDGSLDTSLNPIKQYAAGTFNPILIATDSLGCSATFNPNPNIIVRPAPKASFWASDTLVCDTIATIQFRDSSTNAIRWFWDFGDGTTSLQQNPRHNYRKGVYTVMLVVTNNFGCTDTMIRSKLINVFKGPKANFSVLDTSLCLPATFNFTDISTLGDTTLAAWHWNFGIGVRDTSNVQNPAYIYNSPGSYGITLVISDYNNCHDTLTRPNFVLVFDTLPPVNVPIYRASVLTANAIEVVWEPSVWINFSGYQIFRKDANAANSAFALIHTENNRLVTRFVDLNVTSNSTSYCYLIRVIDECGRISTIDYSLMHCTILLTTQPTVIPDQIGNDLTWNAYVGFVPNRYYIFRKSPSNGGFFLLDSVPGTQNNYSDLGLCDMFYTYKVEAIGPNAAINYAMSNEDSSRPNYVFINQASEMLYATVAENKVVKIAWRMANIPNAKYILIDRSVDGTNNWIPMWKIVSATDSIYLDSEAKFNQHFYAYRIRVQDHCGNNTPYSGIGQTMLLKTEYDEDWNIKLNWNGYQSWKSGISHYKVERYNPNTTTFDSIARIQNTESQFIDQYKYASLPFYQYRIVAVEQDGNYAQSMSNYSEQILPVTVYAPNAFSPNKDGNNDLFEVKGLHIKDFSIEIFDRWGKKVFESNDLSQQWDGSINGSIPQSGSYVYIIYVTGYNNQKLKRAGSVFIL